MFGWEFPPYNSGGLGVACQGLVRALSKLGIHVVFVLPKRLPAASPHARFVFADIGGAAGLAIDSPLVAYATSASYGRRAEERSLYGENLFEEVMRYASVAGTLAMNESFDVVYAHDWLSFPAGIKAARASGKPLIVHVHATEFDRCGGPIGVNSHVYAIEREAMETADRVIAVSEYTKRIIVEQYGIPENKVRVVHNGIDDETMPQSSGGRSRLTALKDAGYSLILFLGRITLQKGPDYFLRAAQRVLEHEPRAMFILSGSGDMERQMMEFAAELGIAEHVLFSGFLRGGELHEAYRLADLFVMPSVSEPFGISALEAMKLGTPVLISKQSGVSEAVRHVLKADFWDIEEMANKMLSVVAHEPLRAMLSENSAREAERLTWMVSGERVEGVIRELVPKIAL